MGSTVFLASEPITNKANQFQTIQDSLANKSDTAKHWQGVSPRMRCVVASFRNAFASIRKIRKGIRTYS